MMERLTYYRASDGAVCCHVPVGATQRDLIELTTKVYERLAYYEDAEERRKLIMLPVSIGDNVYYCRFDKKGNGWYTELIVQGVHITVYRNKRNVQEDYIVCLVPATNRSIHIALKELGVNLFTSRKEAQERIANKCS